MTPKTPEMLNARIGPLRIQGVDDSLDDEALGDKELLAELANRAAPGSSEDVIRRLRETAPPEVSLFAISVEPPELLYRIVWPLRDARASYALGHFLGTVALAGLVSEMISILIFEIAQVCDQRLSEDTQVGLFGSSFERLGQDRRVKVLAAMGLIDEDSQRLFDSIRLTRRKYLHFWVVDGANDVGDARGCLAAVTTLTERTIGHSIENGALVMPERLRRYISSHQMS